jgi:hypothetical protein
VRCAARALGLAFTHEKGSSESRNEPQARVTQWSLRDCCEVFKAAGTFLKGLAALLAAIAALLAALTHWF